MNKKMKNEIKAVIFDMDGVLTDTQSLHDQANAEILQSYGIPLTAKELTVWAGIPQRRVFEETFKKYNVDADIEKAIADKWELVKKRVTKVELIPGVMKFIQDLYNDHIALAVASSCRFDFIEHILKKLNIEKYFSAVVSGHDLKNGKPHPDIFLNAAKEINVNPINCIVVEDAPSGVQAAKSAGMKCIAITTTHKKEDLKQADKIIDSFNELLIEDISNL